MLLATIDASIMLIAMPDIFRGIGLNPLAPANSFYLLWMILGFLVVTSVLVVSLGRLGDLYGRRRIFLFGVLLFAIGSSWCGFASSITSLIIARGLQGVGAAFLVPGSLAIISSSYPEEKRGHAARSAYARSSS